MGHRWFSVLVTWLVTSCLPGDDRPPPGRLDLVLTSSDAMRDGFETDDGWTIRFDRFVVTVGEVVLDGAGCVDYGFSSYHRIFDLTAANGERVARIHGLGDCMVLFGVPFPERDAVLTPGVTNADQDLLLERAVDIVRGDYLGATMFIEGAAQRDAVTKRFAWLIRKDFRVSTCFTPDGALDANEVRLVGDEEVRRALEVRPRELFRVLPNHGERVEFSRFAAADRNEDGRITLAELDEVMVAWDAVLEAMDAALPGGVRSFSDDDDPLLRPAPRESLATLLQAINAGRVVAFSTAEQCDPGLYHDFPF